MAPNGYYKKIILNLNLFAIQNKRYWMLLLLSLGIYSCYDNQIYFSLDKQQISTCNKQKIDNIYIEREDGKEYFHITKNTRNGGSNTINVFKLSPSYSVSALFDTISNKDFKLSPNSKYFILNSTFGDATSRKSNIVTDDRGYVISTSHPDCE